MRKKIIFLDVDGVLNPMTNIWARKQKGEPTSSYYIKLPGDKIYRLKRICDATGADCVCSSSWRIGFQKSTMQPSEAYINLKSQLNPYGINLIDWTPLHIERHRGTEIEWWLKNFESRYKYRPGYIIIDDELHDIIDMHRGHCVKTTTLLGLQEEHVNIAINLLNSQF